MMTDRIRKGIQGYGIKGRGLKRDEQREIRIEGCEEKGKEARDLPISLHRFPPPSLYLFLSLQIHQLLQHFIAGRNSFGIRLECTLRHDHIDKLFPEIDI